MSTNVILIAAGVVLIFAGLAKAGSGQSGGFNLRNFGINIGSTNTQTNKVGNIVPNAAKTNEPDWVGLTIAGIGLVTAFVGLFKSLIKS
jgi:hypothetical protein